MTLIAGRGNTTATCITRLSFFRSFVGATPFHRKQRRGLLLAGLRRRCQKEEEERLAPEGNRVRPGSGMPICPKGIVDEAP
jgi:hypothetical protein